MKKYAKNKAWIVVLFTVILLLKSCLMVMALQDHWQTFFSSMSMLSMIRLVSTYAAFCILASFPLIISKRWWVGVIGQGLMDIWLIGNLIYFRAYDDLLNVWAVLNIGNMKGFGTSVLSFIQISDVLFIALTLLFALIVWIERKRLITQFSWRVWPVEIAIMALLMVPWCWACKKMESPYNPFSAYYHNVSMGRQWYCTAVGPIAHGINECVGGCRYLFKGSFIPEESFDLSSFYKEPPQPLVSIPNMILIFVESLESWVINFEVEGQEVTPHLNRFCRLPEVSYFPYIKDQTRQGKSSDAQLLLFAGLRPIEDGAVSMRFAGNTYYSLCDAMRPSSSKMYVPTPSSEWNQKAMTKAWHIDDLYAHSVSDRVLIQQVLKDVESLPQPYFISFVTLASHAPFTAYADSLPLNNLSAYPHDMQNYLHSIHYTDACLGDLLDVVYQNMRPTVLAIMGDHTIFYSTQRNAYAQFVGQELEAFVPLILYTPHQTPVSTKDTIGQVDIYSLLLPYVQQNTYWQGVGNFGSSDEEQKAISSWIIHTDAFRQ